MKTYDINALAKLVDHTNLHADATSFDMQILCNEAAAWNFASVAINQVQVPQCRELLKDTDVRIDAAISFPLGQTSIFSKITDARDAMEYGADEIDYVVNLTQVKDGNWDYVKEEMESIVAICKEGRGGGTRGAAEPVVSKVIFENCYLTDDEKITLCHIASEVKPDFIKTSTGFGTGGATLDDIRLMRENTDPAVKIKAAGGIRTVEDFLAYVDAGVDRIGCSASVQIFEERSRRFG
ncbi:MAG: deoxyribose-phosphate aldolase [Atopobiaceae bacterium]|nr:deoxyribose-phosphate aldolase [Atopobiaceae bacterium]